MPNPQAVTYTMREANIARIEHAPEEAVERLFGQPPLRSPEADAPGFRHDGDADRLVWNASQDLGAAWPEPVRSTPH